MNTKKGGDHIILHIDVNSAYLSWEAAYHLQHGAASDLRKMPSVVGGDIENRHGIVLAKSIPAGKFGIYTGEVLWQAANVRVLWWYPPIIHCIPGAPMRLWKY